MNRTKKRFIWLVALFILATVIALPQSIPLKFNLLGNTVDTAIGSPRIDFDFYGNRIQKSFEIKRGLDLQGGMQIVLRAIMTDIPTQDRQVALDSAREILLRRVDLYGIAEPVIQTAVSGDEYRLLVELPGIEDPQQALSLVGETAQLDFRLITVSESEVATTSGITATPIGLSGSDLKRATVQFDPQTGEPVVGIEFNTEGAKLFADITTEHTGEMLGIFLDNQLLMAPRITQPIAGGQASISGQFTPEDAKQLSVQLNAGALPVPIEVLEQRTIGASLGADSVQRSLRAGAIGLTLLMTFMILYYGKNGIISSVVLVMYGIFTIAIYKWLSITLTLPGIAGLLLSIGMAVDSNILIFERMKEELRLGKPFEVALELGFGRAWDSIKDANSATIMTALVLINPLNFAFLNTSGLVRGFGVTLLIGVLLSLFTGVFVTRTIMRLFLKGTE
ncbi:MAG: protein translocase subunit SecD [Microgenomates group bacterium]